VPADFQEPFTVIRVHTFQPDKSLVFSAAIKESQACLHEDGTWATPGKRGI
jgi:hypothetical protein